MSRQKHIKSKHAKEAAHESWMEQTMRAGIRREEKEKRHDIIARLHFLEDSVVKGIEEGRRHDSALNPEYTDYVGNELNQHEEDLMYSTGSDEFDPPGLIKAPYLAKISQIRGYLLNASSKQVTDIT